MNIILNVDSYKISHFKQYPDGTQFISSYIESRGGEYPFTLFFGLQMFLKELRAPTHDEVEYAGKLIEAHGYEFNWDGWRAIADLGYLPVRIQAVPEGTVLETKNVLVQVVNTDERFPWLTSYLETAILRAVWYPTTVATRSKSIKNMLQMFAEQNSDDPGGIIFKLHDFGFRGVSSYESGSIGGIAHLVNFMGSDTIGALEYGRKYYHENVAGFSIPAAEHSTITSWGRDKEIDAYRNMLKQFAKPGALVAVVSDSYDIYNAAQNIWGDALRQEVIDSGATIIVRPDSGDPTIVPVNVIEMLGERFGFTMNTKGYKVLPKCVRVIQGDGVNEESIETILTNLGHAGWSIDNIAFGMGGELLQTPNRDTLKFAMKASWIQQYEYTRDVFKDPVTDKGKRSKMGRLALIENEKLAGPCYRTIREDQYVYGVKNLLVDVYRDGKLLKDYTLKEIRDRSNQ